MTMAVDSNALDILQQQTGDMEQKLAILVETRTKKLRDDKAKHTASLRTDKENIATLKGKIAQTTESSKHVLAVQQQREAAKAMVQSEITELGSHASELNDKKREKDATIAALLQKKNKLAETKRALSRRESDTSTRLTEGLEMYKQWLGLDFCRREDEQLQLIFTRINEADPDKKYFFTVHIDDTNNYQVTECSPRVTAVPEMLERLQQTNDFGAFVREMRLEFKKL